MAVDQEPPLQTNTAGLAELATPVPTRAGVPAPGTGPRSVPASPLLGMTQPANRALLASQEPFTGLRPPAAGAAVAAGGQAQAQLEAWVTPAPRRLDQQLEGRQDELAAAAALVDEQLLMTQVAKQRGPGRLGGGGDGSQPGSAVDLELERWLRERAEAAAAGHASSDEEDLLAALALQAEEQQTPGAPCQPLGASQQATPHSQQAATQARAQAALQQLLASTQQECDDILACAAPHDEAGQAGQGARLQERELGPAGSDDDIELSDSEPAAPPASSQPAGAQGVAPQPQLQQAHAGAGAPAASPAQGRRVGQLDLQESPAKAGQRYPWQRAPPPSAYPQLPLQRSPWKPAPRQRQQAGVTGNAAAAGMGGTQEDLLYLHALQQYEQQGQAASSVAAEPLGIQADAGQPAVVAGGAAKLVRQEGQGDVAAARAGQAAAAQQQQEQQIPQVDGAAGSPSSSGDPAQPPAAAFKTALYNVPGLRRRRGSAAPPGTGAGAGGTRGPGVASGSPGSSDGEGSHEERPAASRPAAAGQQQEAEQACAPPALLPGATAEASEEAGFQVPVASPNRSAAPASQVSAQQQPAAAPRLPAADISGGAAGSAEADAALDGETPARASAAPQPGSASPALYLSRQQVRRSSQQLAEARALLAAPDSSPSASSEERDSATPPPTQPAGPPPAALRAADNTAAVVVASPPTDVLPQPGPSAGRAPAVQEPAGACSPTAAERGREEEAGAMDTATAPPRLALDAVGEPVAAADLDGTQESASPAGPASLPEEHAAMEWSPAAGSQVCAQPWLHASRSAPSCNAALPRAALSLPSAPHTAGRHVSR